jgi:glyceraldehyde-3-phosphate dehydrogenase/erythrose-4-phosphate dehydrogenase
LPTVITHLEESKMPVRVAINGFGRIGRLVFRAAMEAGRKDIEFVAINDLGSPEDNAHLLKYDSVHGTFPGAVSATSRSIRVAGKSVRVFSERNPAALPWDKLGVDIALEYTGIFASRDKAAMRRSELRARDPAHGGLHDGVGGAGVGENTVHGLRLRSARFE